MIPKHRAPTTPGEILLEELVKPLDTRRGSFDVSNDEPAPLPSSTEPGFGVRSHFAWVRSKTVKTSAGVATTMSFVYVTSAWGPGKLTATLFCTTSFFGAVPSFAGGTMIHVA